MAIKWMVGGGTIMNGETDSNIKVGIFIDGDICFEKGDNTVCYITIDEIKNIIKTYDNMIKERENRNV